MPLADRYRNKFSILIRYEVLVFWVYMNVEILQQCMLAVLPLGDVVRQIPCKQYLSRFQ